MLYEIKLKQYNEKFDVFIEKATFVLDTVMLLKLLENAKIEGNSLIREISNANVGEVGVLEVTERGEKFQIEISKF